LSLDNSQSDFSELNVDFPDLEEGAGLKQVKPNGKAPFRNVIRDNDSTTHCAGFINQVRNVNGVFYVKAGVVMGSIKASDQDYRARITNVELRVGPTLKVWAQSFRGDCKPCARVRVNLVIRNLTFCIKTKGDNSFLESRGTVETITYGHID
jgi:hypothetical protein